MRLNSIRLFFTILLTTLPANQAFFYEIFDSQLRIVGGKATTIDQFPYQVSVIYIDSHICGGSLVHPQYVITAAHCTDEIPEQTLLVRAGSTYLNQDGTIKEVTKTYQHPDFDPNTLKNDIALLKLVSAFTLSPVIQLVPLPNPNDPIEAHQFGKATGWGRLSDKGPLPFELQEVELPTLTNDECESSHDGLVSETMFCAGFMEGGKDTCQGDSGGPFVISGILVGITSWGEVCAAPNRPGVYTKVSAFVDFINSIIKTKNLLSNTYQKIS